MAVFSRVLLWIKLSGFYNLPPKSVGGSVDKMFAIRCRPGDTRPTEDWLKNHQNTVFNPENVS